MPNSNFRTELRRHPVQLKLPDPVRASERGRLGPMLTLKRKNAAFAKNANFKQMFTTDAICELKTYKRREGREGSVTIPSSKFQLGWFEPPPSQHFVNGLAIG